MINVNSEISTTDPCQSCDALLRMERTASTESPRHADAHVAFRRDVSAVKTPVMLLFIENREAATGCLRGVNAELPQTIIGVCFCFSTDVFESTIDSHERGDFTEGGTADSPKKARTSALCALPEVPCKRNGRVSIRFLRSISLQRSRRTLRRGPSLNRSLAKILRIGSNCMAISCEILGKARLYGG